MLFDQKFTTTMIVSFLKAIMMGITALIAIQAGDKSAQTVIDATTKSAKEATEMYTSWQKRMYE